MLLTNVLLLGNLNKSCSIKFPLEHILKGQGCLPLIPEKGGMAATSQGSCISQGWSVVSWERAKHHLTLGIFVPVTVTSVYGSTL